MGFGLSTVSLLLFSLFVLYINTVEAGTFKINGPDFELDGKPFIIRSGSVHYFRVRSEQWEDRLNKLKAMGLNTVMTVVPWNTHNPQPNSFDFSGMLDLVKYIKTAQKLGLFVIIRASPYICAEYEGGGIPPWIQQDPEAVVRSSAPNFINPFRKFMDVLVPKLKMLQYNTYGGPIILLQLENEYGYYGTDMLYQEQLRDAYVERGMKDTPFFESNGAATVWVNSVIPGVLKTMNVDAGTDPRVYVGWYRSQFPNTPTFVTEWWDGWFDKWGQAGHSVRNGTAQAINLDWLCANKVSFSLYMFHGGTNFGFTSGANSDGTVEPLITYSPLVTSYDYNSALNESGDPTDKWYKFRDVINKYYPIKEKTISPSPKASYGKITLYQSLQLNWNDENQLDMLGVRNPATTAPKPMEHFGQNDGFILYKSSVMGPRTGANIDIREVHDRFQIYQKGKYLDTWYRNDKPKTWKVDVASTSSEIQLFVENMGRLNFGEWLQSDRKGLVGKVFYDSRIHFHWRSWSFNLNSTVINRIPYTSNAIPAQNTPTFYRGSFNIQDKNPLDTFISYEGWTKGVIWVNGFNLGRYWNVGPQRTLYVPSSILKNGRNEVVVFELHNNSKDFSLYSVPYANLG